ncbi:hypothetical protein COV19_07450 [Candidatus Woesearchaeota archaeon CG10_big_fil_rev_8_21_14_0_10_44_13]|nr:MAG: hypothetical protein COV19_07450 [Candidatus Woesearchaeota archaeon CG10_big_fil_rev_8_21_14_0_10_44_13]
MPKSTHWDNKRLPEIDFLRGIAIIMMAVFHFMWDLSYFNGIHINLYSGFWGIFQKLTGGLFILLVGVSLTLSYSKSRDRSLRKFILRGLTVFCYGLIITIFSYLFARQSIVFFGILHFIGISIMIATPFIRKRYLNMLLGIAALASAFWIGKIRLGFPWLVWVWDNHPVNTLDLYPLLPWIGVVFLGLFFGNVLYPEGRRRLKLAVPGSFSAISRPIRFLGRNSLLLYFLHLPVMFGLAYIISLIV